MNDSGHHTPYSALDNAYPGNLIMVVAPSGAGKSSLVAALLERDQAIRHSVSYTTRTPRSCEQDGREYHFISVAKFKALRDEHEFLEWAEVHGNYYATSRRWIEDQMKNGTDVLLEIDWQGAKQIQRQFDNAVEIFILPPSVAVLEERLTKRGQDAPHVISRRLLNAGSEMSHASEADFIVINQQFDIALQQLHSIVLATRLRVGSQRARHGELFVQLGIH